MTDYRLFSVAGKQVQSSGRLITSNNQLLNQSDMINGVSNPGDSTMTGGIRENLKHAEISSVAMSFSSSVLKSSTVLHHLIMKPKLFLGFIILGFAVFKQQNCLTEHHQI